MLAPLVLTATFLLLLLLAEYRGSALGKWLTKPFASTGFIWLGWAVGAPRTAWGTTIMVGLGLCMLGDVLLIPKDRRAFLAGLIAFLAGHIAYVAAFIQRGVDPVRVSIAAGVLALVALPVMRWLWPHLPGRMRGPVVAYVVVISAMVAAAVGALPLPAHPDLILPGALLFYVSDLCVARNRFVQPGFANRLLGLPLYYAGNVLIALSTALRPWPWS